MNTKGKTVNIKSFLADYGIVVGSALAGGLAGHAIGKPAFGSGLLTAGAGLYLMQKFSNKPYGKLIAIAGIAMIASHYNNNETVSGISGFEGFLADAKLRAIEYLKGKGQQTYLSKVAPGIASKLGLGDTDDVSYYTTDGLNDIDTSEVDNIINEIALKNKGVGNISDVSELMGADSSELLNGMDPLTAAANSY
jgi:hypothetical protein